MEPKKYWWISVSDYGDVWDKVLDIHPFTYMNMNYKDQADVALINYHTIIVDEYNLWLQLNNKE